MKRFVKILILLIVTTMCLTSCMSPAIKPEKAVIVEKYDSQIVGKHNCTFKVRRLEKGVVTTVVMSSYFNIGDTVLYRFNTREHEGM